jgi:hypothetical protein
MSVAYDSTEFINAITHGDLTKIDDILSDFPDRLNKDINERFPAPLLCAIQLKKLMWSAIY